MAEVLTGLLTGDALKPVYLAKSKAFDEKTVSAGSKESLDLKVAAEEADTWHVLKRNKRSVRLANDKPVDRQLEDDVWSLGDNWELFNGRYNFYGKGKKGRPRSVDHEVE